MKISIYRDDVNEEWFPADAKLKDVLENIGADTDTTLLAVRVGLTYMEPGWWSVFTKPSDTNAPPLETWEFDWSCIPPRRPPSTVPTIRMRMDGRYLFQHAFVQDRCLAFRFRAFLDSFAIVFARQMYYYRRRYLEIHPGGEADTGDSWARNRLLKLGYRVDEI